MFDILPNQLGKMLTVFLPQFGALSPYLNSIWHLGSWDPRCHRFGCLDVLRYQRRFLTKEFVNLTSGDSHATACHLLGPPVLAVFLSRRCLLLRRGGLGIATLPYYSTLKQ